MSVNSFIQEGCSFTAVDAVAVEGAEVVAEVVVVIVEAVVIVPVVIVGDLVADVIVGKLELVVVVESLSLLKRALPMLKNAFAQDFFVAEVVVEIVV
jgi:hypothetical protein